MKRTETLRADDRMNRKTPLVSSCAPEGQSHLDLTRPLRSSTQSIEELAARSPIAMQPPPCPCPRATPMREACREVGGLAAARAGRPAPTLTMTRAANRPCPDHQLHGFPHHPRSHSPCMGQGANGVRRQSVRVGAPLPVLRGGCVRKASSLRTIGTGGAEPASRCVLREGNSVVGPCHKSRRSCQPIAPHVGGRKPPLHPDVRPA